MGYEESAGDPKFKVRDGDVLQSRKGAKFRKEMLGVPSRKTN